MLKTFLFTIKKYDGSHSHKVVSFKNTFEYELYFYSLKSEYDIQSVQVVPFEREDFSYNEYLKRYF